MRWCTGDQIFDNGAKGAPDTTYRVFGPATVPGDPNSAPSTPVCTKTFPGVQGNLVPLLKGANPALVTYFRRWYTLPCPGMTAGAGDYFVQVTSSSGSGHNRFAIRAGLGSDYTTTNIGVFGNGRMAIYANVGGGKLTTFYLTRLLPGAKGRTLVLNLFDIGDAAASGTLTVVPPTEYGTAFPNCSYTKPPGNATGPPWGAFVPTKGPPNDVCEITPVTKAAFNGQWIQMRIPVPDDYHCSTNVSSGCWVKINYLFTGDINDTTSWAAYVDGDPVRLVK